MISFLLFLLLAVLIVRSLPRPKLDASHRSSSYAAIHTPQELDQALDETESKVTDVLPNAKAHIVWQNSETPAKTKLCFLYLHGFSASWQETAPLCENLARHYETNLVQGRLFGHGLKNAGLPGCAEDWLQSARDQFEIARKLGEQVVIVSVSTGCPIATWLTTQYSEQILANIFLAPNFRIRNPFGFLLTWPLAPKWVHLVVGKRRSWEPQSEAEGLCWTHDYSTDAVIEMQKVVDWAKAQAYESISVPVYMMYMENDPTVYPPAAIKVFDRFGAREKQLKRVTLNGDAEDHVFVGEITHPERLDWVQNEIIGYLDNLSAIKGHAS